MKNRTLFGFFIECIFMTFGIYVIVINLLRLQTVQDFFDVTTINGHVMNFDGWHSYEPYGFRGMSWFFGKFESFPGFEYFKASIQDLINHVPSFSSSLPDNILDMVIYIGTILFLPFRAVGSIIIDVFRCVGWFFTFLI